MSTRKRRRSALRRWLDHPLHWLRYFADIDYARRSNAGKKAAQTRRARRGESMAVKFVASLIESVQQGHDYVKMIKASAPEEAHSQETT